MQLHMYLGRCAFLAERQERAWRIWKDREGYRMAGDKSPKWTRGDEAREVGRADCGGRTEDCRLGSEGHDLVLE